MPIPMVELAAIYLTATGVQKELGLSRFQLDLRIERGVLPKPTYIDKNNVRYFSDGWLTIAKKILEQNHNNKNTNAKSREREG
jgi:predicted DNA-binding transcriptional regulator AlpA